MELRFGVEKTEKTDGKLEYCDRARIQAGAALRASATTSSQKLPKASAKINFKGQGAFLYHLSGITTLRFANSRAFYEELALKWLAGEVRFNEKSVLVNEIRAADKATIIVSEGNEGSVELQGNFTLSGPAILAGVKGNLRVAASAGSLFQWLAAGGTIPLIGLVRPVMGPTDDGNPPPSALARTIKRIRNLFAKNNWDIHLIHLRDFVESSRSIIVTAELPNEEIIAVGFYVVDAGVFSPSNDTPRGTSLIGKNTSGLRRRRLSSKFEAWSSVRSRNPPRRLPLKRVSEA